MADITGTANDETLTGTPGADTITGDGGDDIISGLGGDDVIYGDYGPSGPASGTGLDASPLQMLSGNAQNEAPDGSSVEYRNIAFLDDGTPILGKVILVSKTDPNLAVDLSASNGILLNGNNNGSMRGEEATIRIEFYNQLTGDPVVLNTVATFNDLDRARNGTEQVEISKQFVSGVATSQNTSLNVTDTGGSFTATGTINTNPNNQNAWFSTLLEDQEAFEFTITARGGPSGYGFNGSLIDAPAVIPNEPGDDTIDGGAGNDVIDGGQGNDTIQGGTGDDTLIGGDGNDFIEGGEGNDIIDGGAGNDVLSGGAGDDTITAGAGRDEVFGGVGNDLIFGGGENDLLFGGDDRDTFTVVSGPSDQPQNTTVQGGSGGDDFDTLDLTQMLAEGWTVTNIVKNPETNGAPGFNGQVQLVRGNEFANINFTDIEKIICFTPGTAIATARGEMPVEALRPGDKVMTRDNGLQELRWIGQRALSRAEMEIIPAFCPVLIRKGALVHGLPERDMRVSPNHRMLIASPDAALLFEDSEVLVAAKHLVGKPGIERVIPDAVTYVHIMCRHHEVILADGAWTESFQPDDASLKSVGEPQKAEIFALFPELAQEADYPTARRALQAHEARLLAL